jgi:hypothetical protein
MFPKLATPGIYANFALHTPAAGYLSAREQNALIEHVKATLDKMPVKLAHEVCLFLEGRKLTLSSEAAGSLRSISQEFIDVTRRGSKVHARLH